MCVTELVPACEFSMIGPSSQPVREQTTCLGATERLNYGKLTDAFQFFSKSFFFAFRTESLRMAMTESGSKVDMPVTEVDYFSET